MVDLGTIRIAGRDYAIADLELNELEELEERCGAAFPEINWESAKALKALAHILRRRDNPSLTAEEAGKIKLVEFLPPEEDDASPPAGSGGA